MIVLVIAYAMLVDLKLETKRLEILYVNHAIILGFCN